MGILVPIFVLAAKSDCEILDCPRIASFHESCGVLSGRDYWDFNLFECFGFQTSKYSIKTLHVPAFFLARSFTDSVQHFKEDLILQLRWHNTSQWLTSLLQHLVSHTLGSRSQLLLFSAALEMSRCLLCGSMLIVEDERHAAPECFSSCLKEQYKIKAVCSEHFAG